MNEEQALSQVQPPSHPQISHRVMVGLIIALTIAGLILIFRGSSGLRQRQGQLVGVATADGRIRYGELVLADSKSVILRDVFISGGYYTPPQGEAAGPSSTPSYQVDPEWASGANMDSGTVVIPRNQVLFMTSDVADFAVKAVRSWTPTPSPTLPPLPSPASPFPPKETLAPVEKEGVPEGETEREEVEVEDLPISEETVVSTAIPSQVPSSTPAETPVVTSTP